jgi:hypothetical protein
MGEHDKHPRPAPPVPRPTGGKPMPLDDPERGDAPAYAEDVTRIVETVHGTPVDEQKN